MKTHGVIVVCTQLILQSIEIPILYNTNPNYSWFRNIGMKHLYKSVMHVPKSKQHVCGPVDMVVAAPLSERTQQTTVHTRLHHWCVGTTIINVDEEAVCHRQLPNAHIPSSLILIWITHSVSKFLRAIAKTTKFESAYKMYCDLRQIPRRLLKRTTYTRLDEMSADLGLLNVFGAVAVGTVGSTSD